MDVMSCTSAADTEPMTNTAAAAAAAAAALQRSVGESPSPSTTIDTTAAEVASKNYLSTTTNKMNDHSNNSHHSNRSPASTVHPQPHPPARLPSISNIPPPPIVVMTTKSSQQQSMMSHNSHRSLNSSSNHHTQHHTHHHQHHHHHHTHYTSSIPTVTTTMKSMTYYQSILQPPPVSFPLCAATTLLLGITTEYWTPHTYVYLVPMEYMTNWLIWCLHQTTTISTTTTTTAATSSNSSNNHNNNNSSSSSSAAAEGGMGSNHIPPMNNTTTTSHNSTNEHYRLQDCVRTIALQYQLPILPTIGMPYTNPGPINSASLSYSKEYPHLLFPPSQSMMREKNIRSTTDPDATHSAPSSSASVLVLSSSSSPPRLLQVYQPCVDPYATTSTILVHPDGTTNTSTTNATATLTTTTTTTTTAAPYPITQRDVSIRSLPDDFHTNGNSKNNETNGLLRSCLAIPETFYDFLRSIHGVCCDDHHSISFQSSISTTSPISMGPNGSNHNTTMTLDPDDVILHHHTYDTTTTVRQHQQQSHLPIETNLSPRPIEFRRKIVYQTGVVGKTSSKTISEGAPSTIVGTSTTNKKTPSEKALVSIESTTSLMDKLLLEQQVEQKYLMVEIHPIQLFYSYYDEDDVTKPPKDSVDRNPIQPHSNDPIATTTNDSIDDNNHKKDSNNQSNSVNGSSTCTTRLYQPQRCGFVFVSRDTPALHAFLVLQQLTAPHKVKQCVRFWSQWMYSNTTKTSGRYPTTIYDGYELIDMEKLIEEKIIPLQQQLAMEMGNHPSINDPLLANQCFITIGSFVERHHITPNTNELDILIETRRTVDTVWPRIQYELPVRIQPGDYVDAQDVTGQWYEAIVREVDDNHNTVLVHYTGWASKWDSKIRRKDIVPDPTATSSSVPDVPPMSPSTSTRVKAPAPLWSQSGRWRERLKVGDVIEVRDSSSVVDRPKWYKGIVKYIGGKNETPRPLTGGAEIELYDVIDPTNPNKISTMRQPLLLLNRTQQILVEVEQERMAKAGNNNNMNSSRMLLSSESSVSDSLAPHPPYIRWVNLFGEEICKIGTHLKETKDEKPVTLRYEYDANRKPVSVMKSHPTLGSGFVRESLRGTPPAPGSVGLHNLGNSCFLNSTVQCLNHISVLTQFFVQDKYSKDLNQRNPLGSGGNVAVAYASLLKKIWAGEHSVLVPRMLKQTVANFAPQFDNSYQHDSHEFCQFLMDGLHEDLNRVKTKPYVEELEGFGLDDEKAAIESWKKHLLRHDSVIVDHCQGMHRSHLTCPQCGRESIKFDVYSSISLPLPTDKNRGTIRLEDCIEKFMEAEQLDDRDAYYCPNCRRHVCALKLIALWTIPDVLILHLKRFTFDTCMSSGSMLRSKIDNKVEFPINNLDLSKIVLGPKDPSAPPIYNLFGVSEHIGPTANSGHYTATVRNSIDGQWYRCNDSHVGLTSGEASITGGAYLLFYQRAKGSTRWGGMYRAMKELNIDPYGISEPIDKEGFRQVKLKKKKKP